MMRVIIEIDLAVQFVREEQRINQKKNSREGIGWERICQRKTY